MSSLKLPKVDINKRYYISFWARKLAGPNDSVPTLYIGGVKDNQKELRIESSTWKKVGKEFTAAEESLYFEFWIMEGSGNVVDIDEISIQEVN